MRLEGGGGEGQGEHDGEGEVRHRDKALMEELDRPVHHALPLTCPPSNPVITPWLPSHG